jgi:hypothetical protein
MNLELLNAPFAPEDVEWRVQQKSKDARKPWAMALAYIDNRAIMERLDAVCGKAGWQTRATQLDSGGFLVEIGIKVGDIWVWKGDVSDSTDVEAIKGGYSGAMKRAGAQWGIGRYLYNLDTTFVDLKQKGNGVRGDYSLKIGDTFFVWNKPKLPSWAMPSASVKTNLPKDVEEIAESFGGETLLPLEDEDLNKAIDFVVKNGQSGLDSISKKYYISPQQIEILQEYI